MNQDLVDHGDTQKLVQNSVETSTSDSDSVRLVATAANACLIGLGFVLVLAGYKSLANLPFLFMACALLMGALIAESRKELFRFWLFSVASLLLTIGL